MVIKNKLDQSFGPTGTTAGRLIFVVGFVTVFYSNFGLVLVLLGAFLGFTYTSTWFDVEKKRIKPTENIFGFLPYGNWIKIEPEMKLGVSKHVQGFQVLSQSNKSAEIIERDFRISIYDGELRKIMDLKKFSTRELAENELNQLVLLLGIDHLPTQDSKLSKTEDINEKTQLPT